MKGNLSTPESPTLLDMRSNFIKKLNTKSPLLSTKLSANLDNRS
jgi:hypothetical protein